MTNLAMNWIEVGPKQADANRINATELAAGDVLEGVISDVSQYPSTFKPGDTYTVLTLKNESTEELTSLVCGGTLKYELKDRAPLFVPGNKIIITAKGEEKRENKKTGKKYGIHVFDVSFFTPAQGA